MWSFTTWAPDDISWNDAKGMELLTPIGHSSLSNGSDAFVCARDQHVLDVVHSTL